MNRRDLLAASGTTLALGVGGCIGDSLRTNPNDDEDSPGDEHSGEYNLAVENADASGEVQLDATVERHVTDHHPGALAMELTNGSDEQRTFWYIGGTMAPFNQEWLSHVEEEDASIVLLVPGLVDHERHGGCWVGSGDDDVRRHATLKSGESLSREVAVASGWIPRGDEDPPEKCLSVGSYTGKQSLDLYESEEGLEQYGEPQSEKVGETKLELTITLSN